MVMWRLRSCPPCVWQHSTFCTARRSDDAIASIAALWVTTLTVTITRPWEPSWTGANVCSSPTPSTSLTAGSRSVWEVSFVHCIRNGYVWVDGGGDTYWVELALIQIVVVVDSRQCGGWCLGSQTPIVGFNSCCLRPRIVTWPGGVCW